MTMSVSRGVEWGVLLKLLGALASTDDLLRRRMGEHPIDAFNVPFDSWIDTITFCFTMDLVAWYHLRAMENSSFAPWAREMTTMVHEEKFHASFGARRVADVVRSADYARLYPMLPVTPPRNADGAYYKDCKTCFARRSRRVAADSRCDRTMP